MPERPVSPATTLAVVLGASEWPHARGLNNRSFARSASEFVRYLVSETGFELPKENLLDLFDAEHSPNESDYAVSSFLLRRQEALQQRGTPAKDLILFYVGHGGFTPGDRQYFLAIRSTRTTREGPSSLRITDLANTLKNDAATLKIYLILDCCFAGSAYKEFQSGGPIEAIRVQTLDDMPAKGRRPAVPLFISVFLSPVGCGIRFSQRAV